MTPTLMRRLTAQNGMWYPSVCLPLVSAQRTRESCFSLAVYGPVAQGIEQRFPKPRVGCSSRPRAAIQFFDTHLDSCS